MRIVNFALCALLVLFVVVQYNDPDALLWGAIYGIAAVWAGVAAFRASALRRSPAPLLLGLTLVAAIGGVAFYWPQTPHWWMKDVWWETETAREGMGMMIALAAVLVVALTALTTRARA